jgi:hypothetical protein
LHLTPFPTSAFDSPLLPLQSKALAAQLAEYRQQADAKVAALQARPLDARARQEVQDLYIVVQAALAQVRGCLCGEGEGGVGGVTDVYSVAKVTALAGVVYGVDTSHYPVHLRYQCAHTLLHC